MILKQDLIPSKPWWKSKLVLLGLSIVALFGSGALTNFLDLQGVTPEMLEALRQSQPQIFDAIQNLKNGQSWVTVIGSLFGALVTIIRVWFTTTARLNLPLEDFFKDTPRDV